MPAFGTDWWPATVSRPVLRLVLAHILSPLIVAALASGLAYLVLSLVSADAQSTWLRIRTLALTLSVGMVVFSVTLGALGTLALWRMRKRGVLAFFLTGMGLGVAFATLSAVLVAQAAQVTTPLLLVMGIMCAGTFLLIRWLAGLRPVADQ